MFEALFNAARIVLIALHQLDKLDKALRIIRNTTVLARAMHHKAAKRQTAALTDPLIPMTLSISFSVQLFNLSAHMMHHL